ncbi:HNH endonuclease [Armatimonas sp.]|uniref:HNH endonuclease n=1 Tax=Armatimonas sp. TaxID=1872638 RepID=UPI0037523E98
MTEALRAQVRERAGRRCEYCGYPDLIRSGPFAVEHIQPRSAGGSDDLENTAWSCDHCNGHKAAATQAIDPVTGTMAPLYNPRRDVWKDHFLWSDDTLEIIGKTPTGRATVERLKLNRESTVEARRLLEVWGMHPPQAEIRPIRRR